MKKFGLLAYYTVWSVLLTNQVYASTFNSTKYRAGGPKSTVISLSPALDAQKPLALTDYSGFVESSGFLYGAISKSWAVKFSYKDRTPVAWYKIDSTLSVPVLLDGKFIVLATQSGQIIKYNADSGELVWNTKLQSYASKKLLLSSGLILTQDSSGNVVAINYLTGQKSWISKLSNFNDIDVRDTNSIVVSGRKLYVGATRTVEVFLVRNGEKLGQYLTPEVGGKFGAIVGDISFVSGVVIFGRYDGLVFAFKEDNFSQLIWKRKLDSGVTSLQASAGVLHAGSANGYFYRMDLKSGKIIWKIELGAAVASSIVGDNNIFVNSVDGLIVKLQRSSGKLVWIDHLRARVETSPFIFDNQVFFTSSLKNVYGFSLR